MAASPANRGSTPSWAPGGLLHHTTAPRLVWPGLGALVLATVVAALGVGRIGLGPFEVIAALKSAAGFGAAVDPLHEAVVLHARLPRTLTALAAGAGLAVSGAVLQGLFRNPLVGPQSIGVLSGAGLGGALMLFIGAGSLAVTAAAFGFGLAATLAVVWLARASGSESVLILVLSGIVVGALGTALTTMLRYFADPERQLPQLVFWLMGSFSAADFGDFLWLMGAVVPGGLVLFGYALRLDVLASGEDEARALGLSVARDRLIVLALVAGICAAVVSVAGIVGWVGLVVPHMARMLVGPGHRRLLPASACIGGAFLVAVDTVCRSATAAELPIGAVTALIGAPVFIGILWKSAARGWRDD
jgi:iron complex transport system permease protein